MSTVATRHECVARISIHCTRGAGKPKRKACGYCGSLLTTRTGTYGVFDWTGTGHYPARNAVETFTRESVASTWADVHAQESTSPGGYVVRWIEEF